VPLPGTRRRALIQRFARTAAGRLGQLVDPDAPQVLHVVTMIR
jgi:hypothetical protein